MVIKQWGLCQNEHETCIADVATEMFIRDFTVYLEHKISLLPETKKAVVVDIYAKKNEVEILIEVGTLSVIHGDRLQVLRRLKPEAKILHVTQWKNWLTSFDWGKAFEEWRYEKYFKPREVEWIREMGDSLGKKRVEPK